MLLDESPSVDHLVLKQWLCALLHSEVTVLIIPRKKATYVLCLFQVLRRRAPEISRHCAIRVTHCAGFELIGGFHAAVRKNLVKDTRCLEGSDSWCAKILITAYFQITETPWDPARKSVTAELSPQGFACEATHGLQSIMCLGRGCIVVSHRGIWSGFLKTREQSPLFLIPASRSASLSRRLSRPHSSHSSKGAWWGLVVLSGTMGMETGIEKCSLRSLQFCLISPCSSLVVATVHSSNVKPVFLFSYLARS